ncbi:MAG: hypothetical protein AAFO97_15080 [Pseudomonadota bacterium]
MAKPAAIPRTLKKARARTDRKLKALRKRNWQTMMDIAGYFDDGPIGSEIDTLFRDLEAQIERVLEAVDEEIERIEVEAE